MFDHALMRRLFWILPVALLVFFPAGCQKDSPSQPTSPGLRIERVEVDRESLTPSDSTEIRVWVVTGESPGTPVPGASVAFTEALGVDSGEFSKTESVTDAQGWAAAVFKPNPTQSGTVTLKVKAGEDIEYVMLQIGETSSDAVTLTLSSSVGGTSLPADGQSTLLLTLRATRGADSRPVGSFALKLAAGDRFVDLNSNGVFDSGDQIVPGGDRDQDGTWDAEGVLPANVTTDLAGQVSFVFRAGTSVGSVYLKASGSGIATDFEIYQHPTTLQVVVVAAGRELLSDGVSSVPISVKVVDWGSRAIPGVIVKFVAGEPFEDRDEDGFYTSGVDSYSDKNANGNWDAIGSINSTAITDLNGDAFVDYTSGLEPGDVNIRATTSNGYAETLIKLVNIPPAADLDVAPESESLWADGVSETEVTLTVFDVNGLSLAGKNIHLVAGERFQDVNQDGVWSTGDVLLDDVDGNHAWTAMGSLLESIVTDGEGVARLSYRAGLAPGSCWIRATADNNSAEAEVVLRSLPATLAMEVEAGVEILQVIGSGGQDNTAVTATCFDALGTRVPAGVGVQFVIQSGPGGGELIEGSVADVWSTRTDADGVARAYLFSGNRPGQIVIQATSGSTLRTSTVYVGAGPAVTLLARALDPAIDYWSSSQVQVAVQDAYGNPVEDGTVVHFSVDEGVMVGASGPGFSETDGGLATATYQSLGPANGTDYRAVVTAAVEGTTASGSVAIELGNGEATVVSSLELESDRTELTVRGAGGNEEAILRAEGLDTHGRAVGAGYLVTFEIANGPNQGEGLNGSGWGPVNVETDAEGWAEVRLRSGSGAGVVRVQASAPSATTRSLDVAIASGAVATVECYAEADALEENSECGVVAYLYDAAHNPVPDGTVVYFTCDEGLIIGGDGQGSALSEAGVARATYKATLADAAGDGVADITCRAASGESCVTHVRIPLNPGAIARMTLDADLAEIGVKGTGAVEQVRVHARAFDSYNRPVRANVAVTFSIEEGPGGGERFLTGGTSVDALTDNSGQAEVTLLSGTVSGTVVVRAAAGAGASNHTSVAIAAGPPSYIYLGHEACNILACNRVNVENEMVCLVGDVYRNPVRDGTVIYFTTDKGVVEGTEGLGSAKTARGLANAIFRSSGDACEYVTVTASTLGGTLSASNSFIASDDPYSATYLVPSSDLVSLPADGTSTFPIRVEVLDQFGMYTLPADVSYETQYGLVANQEESIDGCSASQAKAEYKSAVLDRDYSYSVPDDGIGAIDDVLCSVGFGPLGDDISVQLLTSAASKDNSEMELESSATPGATLIFNVTIADRHGNPLGGHALSITATGGSVTGSATTDLWGVADGLVFQAPAAPGTYNVTVVDVDPGYSGGLVLSGTVTVQ